MTQLFVPHRSYTLTFETVDYTAFNASIRVPFKPDYSLLSYNEVLHLDNIDRTALRVVFDIQTWPNTQAGIVGGSTISPTTFTIYNLSPTSLAKISTASPTYLSFNAGYNQEDKVSRPQGIMQKARIYRVTQNRNGMDMLTFITVLPGKHQMDTVLKKGDLTIKNMEKSKVFMYLMSHYYPHSFFNIDSSRGFATEKEKAQDWIFKAGTTLGTALYQILGNLQFSIDPSGLWYVFTEETIVRDDSIPLEINQTTGLLGIPFLSATGVIQATTLMNPDIKPGVRVHVQTGAGFRQNYSGGANYGAAQISGIRGYENNVTATVLTVKHQGDSRGSHWVTIFETRPLINFKSGETNDS